MLVFNAIEQFAKQVRISQPVKVDNFLVYNFQKEEKLNYNSLPAYRQGYYELMINISESCSFSVDTNLLPSTKNRITLIKPMQLQKIASYQETSNPSRGFGVFFKPSFFSNTQFSNSLSILNEPRAFSTTFSDEEILEFKDLANKMFYEYNNFNLAISFKIIQNYLEILLLKLNYKNADQTYTVAKNAGHAIVTRFYRDLQKFILDDYTVSDYARLLHISPKHLSETIKSETGKPALQHINEMKIEHAKILLLQTEKTINEVAYDLNFDTPNYFSAFFKSNTGLTPTAYRKIST
jgi:AraC-like DNA-binding protein